MNSPLKIEQDPHSPVAIIVARGDKYKQLIKKLARKLALQGCTVETKEYIRRRSLRAHYLIYLGFPEAKEKEAILNSLVRRLVIAAEASTLANSQKREMKKFPVVFLPKNFLARQEWTTEEILAALFTQPELRRASGNQDIWDSKRDIQTSANIPKPIPDNLDNLITSADLVEKRSHLRPLLMTSLVIILLTVVGLSLLYPYIAIRQTKTNLQSSLNGLETANFTKAKTHALKAQKELAKLKSLYQLTKPAIDAIAHTESQNIPVILQAVSQTVAIITTSAEIGSRGNDFIFRLLNHHPTAVRQETDFFSNRVKLLQEQLSELALTLGALENNKSWIAPQIHKYSVDYQNKLPKTLAVLKEAQSIIPLLPEIVAAEGRKKYLVLFQNNMELRPTGGFIGSVGFLRFTGGKMLELNIEDVYTLDGQLEGHIEPPPPLKKHLGETNWFLRDANWDPDFARSAGQIKWFLKKEIQGEVDGVIAMDLEFAKRVLAALGGVTIPDTNTLITPDNLYLQTQTYSEKEFFPGSTRKRDFLGSLARNILLEINTQGSAPTAKLINAVSSSLAEKHILLNFNSSAVQQVFDGLGWTGRLLVPECQISISLQPRTVCIPDFLMIVDANLGVNKVNYFIERMTGLDIALEKSRLRRVLTLSYTNQGVSDRFPGGIYKNYLRIIVPPNAILESVVLNNRNIDVSQVEQEPLGEYQSLGMLLEVPPSSTRTVAITYATPISLEQSAIYELLVQKQPGTANPPLVMSMQTVADTQLEGQNFTPLAREDSLLYNTTLNTDKIFRVKIL